jgi:carbon-monoxide dehydrogenase large subunit
MSGLSAVDWPNSYIGRSVLRPNLARLLQGRGQYVSDLVLPRTFALCDVRTCMLGFCASSATRHMPGVVAVVTGAEPAAVCFAAGGRPVAPQRSEIGTAAGCRGGGRR